MWGTGEARVEEESPESPARLSVAAPALQHALQLAVSGHCVRGPAIRKHICASGRQMVRYVRPSTPGSATMIGFLYFLR